MNIKYFPMDYEWDNLFFCWVERDGTCEPIGVNLYKCPYQYFMQAMRGDRMIRSQRIPFFEAERQKKPDYNPEENATNNLLQISDQDFGLLDGEEQDFPTIGLHKQSSAFSQKHPKPNNRVPVAENFTKSHRNWRKTSVSFISGEEVCVMRKERVVNLSNFLVFDSKDLNDMAESPPKVDDIHSPRHTNRRNSKMLLNFIKRRNINCPAEPFTDEEGRTRSPGSKRVGSPLQRINHSCELRRDSSREVSNRQIARELSSKAQVNVSPDLRATSPNFRNKKVVNYFKYRLSRNPDACRS